MTRITLHPGGHGPGTLNLVREAWDEERLLVLCPPRVRDFGFLESLPEGELVFEGDWQGREIPRARRGKGRAFPARPVLGVFTTGTSSGEPRLVLSTKRNVLSALDAILSLFDAERITHLFCYPQPSHTFGLMLGYVLSHVRGYELIVPPGRYSSESHRRRCAIDEPGLVTLGTPTHFRDLLEYARVEGGLRPSYSAIVGGGPVPVALWRALRDEGAIAAPSVGYGASEACPGVSHLPPGVEPKEDDEVGFPLPHLAVEPRADGVRFRGDSVALALVDQRGIRFPEEGFLTDRLECRADGRLVFRGRLESVLNRGGEKFSLEAIERELARAGTDALCVKLPHPRLGEELGVLVRGRELSPETRERLRTALHQVFLCRFSDARFRAVPVFPIDANAKPDRRRAADWLRPDVTPVTELEGVVPHRPPMVWVSDVLSSDASGGVCRLLWDERGRYNDENGIRPSSLVELVAQSYAFVRAHAAGTGAVRRAYLAAMTNVRLEPTHLRTGDEVRITVKLIKELGPLALVEGQVDGPAGACLARATLKLFAE